MSSRRWSVSDTFTIRIDSTALDGVLVALQLLKSYLPTNACTSLTKGVAKTKETFADETVKTLNVDFEQIDSEIETTVPDTETLNGYRAEITSKGIPIELYDFAPDAAGWKRKKPVHVQIFRGGATHEFRHVTVGHNQVYGWTKYVRGVRAKRKILSSVRIQDIQAQPYFIDPITEDGADIVIEDYATVIEGILASV